MVPRKPERREKKKLQTFLLAFVVIFVFLHMAPFIIEHMLFRKVFERLVTLRLCRNVSGRSWLDYYTLEKGLLSPARDKSSRQDVEYIF